MDYQAYLTQLLRVFWLRPETALFRCTDCCLAEEWITSADKSRSVDLGCGDGLLSFIMAGGRLPDYDAYLDVTALADHRRGADIFDSPATTAPALDRSGQRYSFQYGVDHKAGLLSKAASLGDFYRHTVQHDLNEPLPFEDGSISFAFSNVLYWLDDLQSILADWRAKLAPGGRLLVFVPNHDFKRKAWLYFDAPHVGRHAYLNYLDRGYAKLIRHCYDDETWRSMFDQAGLTVRHHRSYLTEAATEIWNVGTRPIAPLLIGMANHLSTGQREACRGEWVDFFASFFGPVIEAELGERPATERCLFHMYVLMP